MAKKPRKRPTDVIGNAVFVMQRLTGQIEESPEPEERPKDPAAAALGRKGGRARASKLSKSRRKEIARLGAARRWKREEK
jgi:hypothetical protein